jgi:hypothetical protein
MESCPQLGKEVRLEMHVLTAKKSFTMTWGCVQGAELSYPAVDDLLPLTAKCKTYRQSALVQDSERVFYVPLFTAK